jgi:hypothetical protein
LLTRNRLLVVARLLGRSFPAAVPRLLLRDLADLRRGGQPPGALLLGWAGALRRLPGFAHAGRPLITGSTLRRLGAEAANAELNRRLG